MKENRPGGKLHRSDSDLEGALQLAEKQVERGAKNTANVEKEDREPEIESWGWVNE